MFYDPCNIQRLNKRQQISTWKEAVPNLCKTFMGGGGGGGKKTSYPGEVEDQHIVWTVVIWTDVFDFLLKGCFWWVIHISTENDASRWSSESHSWAFSFKETNHWELPALSLHWNSCLCGFFSDGDFHIFDSGNWYSDLLFTDAAVRLMKIPEDRQNYKTWLGEDFIAQIENLQKYTCVSLGSGSHVVPSLIIVLFVSLLAKILS